MIIRYVLAFFCFSTAFTYSKDYKYELAICTIFRDDAKYIPEWIDFHKAQGVEHFFLYNDLSTDDFHRYLDPYVASGDIDLIEWPHREENTHAWIYTIQTGVYMDCINKQVDTCRWIAFLDTDEFLFSPTKQDLKDVLKSYSSYGGVSVNWVMYGTGGVESIEEGEKLTNLLLWRGAIDSDVNKHVKTIAQPRFVSKCQNPHNFVYSYGRHGVTENKSRIKGIRSRFVSVDKLRINHYWQRDLHFFWSVKAERQKKWWGTSDEALSEFITLYNDIYDPILLSQE